MIHEIDKAQSRIYRSCTSVCISEFSEASSLPSEPQTQSARASATSRRRCTRHIKTAYGSILRSARDISRQLLNPFCRENMQDSSQSKSLKKFVTIAHRHTRRTARLNIVYTQPVTLTTIRNHGLPR
jgi:hypothetical protein